MSEVVDFREWRTSRLVFLMVEYVGILEQRWRPVRGTERKLYEVWVRGMQAELDRRQR